MGFQGRSAHHSIMEAIQDVSSMQFFEKRLRSLVPHQSCAPLNALKLRHSANIDLRTYWHFLQHRYRYDLLDDPHNGSL